MRLVGRRKRVGRRPLRIPATLVACTIVLGWAYTTPNLLDITIDGRAERVERGTTLGQIEVLFRLQPEPGSLLDVNGNVIAEVKAHPRPPWHFVLLVIGVVVYLGYRAVQGIAWLAQRG